MGLLNTQAPDPNVDPWAWTQWAASREPQTYDMGKYEITNDNLDAFKPALIAAGLWKSEWDVGPGGEHIGAGDSGESAPINNRDLSSLAGYKVSDTRGPGKSRYTALWDSKGEQVGQAQGYRDEGSMHGKDWATAASVIGGAYLGATALGAQTAGGAAAAAGGTGALPAGAIPLEVAPTLAAVPAAPTTVVGGGGGLLGGAGEVVAAAGGAESLVGGADAPTTYGSGGGDPNQLTGGGNGLTGGTNTGVPPGEGYNFSAPDFSGAGGTNYLQQLLNGASNVFSGNNSFANSLLGLVGAGVQQHTIEKVARENREYDAKREADKRVRQAPTGTGMLASTIKVKKGTPNAIGG